MRISFGLIRSLWVAACIAFLGLQASHAVPPSIAYPRSVAGKPIVSIPVDSFMTTEQEGKLLAALARSRKVNWVDVTLPTVIDELKSDLPIQVRTAALEEMGLAPDLKLSLAPATQSLPIGSQLAELLKPQGLSFSLRGGAVIISTRDDLEDPANNVVRIYDVTPIVVRRDLEGRPATDFNTLMQSLQTGIQPDSWEALGGPATMSDQVVRDRAFLSVSQTSLIHLQIQAFLDQLNQFEPTEIGQEIPLR